MEGDGREGKGKEDECEIMYVRAYHRLLRRHVDISLFSLPVNPIR